MAREEIMHTCENCKHNDAVYCVYCSECVHGFDDRKDYWEPIEKEKMDTKMSFDENGWLDEPCLTCDKAYVDEIWWCCDEKECPYKVGNEELNANNN